MHWHCGSPLTMNAVRRGAVGEWEPTCLAGPLGRPTQPAGRQAGLGRLVACVAGRPQGAGTTPDLLGGGHGVPRGPL